MTHAPRPWSAARWASLADAIALALLALAAAIALTGGVRVRVWGVSLSLTSAWRPVAIAVLIAAIRHVAFRGDTLWQRVEKAFGAMGDPFLDHRAGVAMYGLVRSLTASRPAAWVTGVAFAFYPFRFEHSQMELLWVCWMPIVLWAVHRTLARGRWRDGLMAGGAFAAQMLSSVYFGLFLAAYLVPVGGVLAFGSRLRLRAVKALAAGALLAAIGLVPLLSPYVYARQELGDRSPAEVAAFSSRPQDYLVAKQTNLIWGSLLGRGPHGPENAFPGVVIVVTCFSTMHWQRILNGYSGAAPLSFHAFRRAMTTFPDEASVRLLRDRGTDYVVLHEEFYGRDAYGDVIRAVEARPDLQERARAVTGGYEARICALVR